jgi:hypothetical protein
MVFCHRRHHMRFSMLMRSSALLGASLSPSGNNMTGGALEVEFTGTWRNEVRDKH